MTDELTMNTNNVKPRRRGTMVCAAVVVATLEVMAAVGLMVVVGGPSGAVADDLAVEGPPAAELTVEIPLLAKRLQNNRDGFTRVYDVEVVLQVTTAHAPRVQEELLRRGHECRAEVIHLWRSMDPAHLDEPNLRTVSRRLKDQMLERFGRDARTTDPVVTDVIVIAGTGFRAD